MAKSLLEQYLEAKSKGIDRTGKAASRNTIRAYYNAIALAERTIGKKVQAFTEADIDTLITELDANGKSASTRNIVVSALNGFFTWALYKDKRLKVTHNPMQGIARKGNGSTIEKRQLLTEEQVLALVAAIEENEHKIASVRHDPDGLFARFDLPERDQAQKYSLITRLLFYGGLRASEALNLRIDQVTEDGLLVLGKGEKYRFVPLPPALKAELDSFVANPQVEGTPYVFVGDRARDKYEARPLQYNQYLNRFRAAADQLGLPKEVTPHSLRHSFGTHALRKTGRLEVVQDLLGHADPATTRIYAQLVKDDLKKEYAKIFD